MSVSSILAFVLAGVAAKRRIGNDDVGAKKRIAELEARVAELEDDIARANELARRDQELIDMWRERALANVPAVIAAPQQNWQLAQQQCALLQQQAALQQAQYNAQHAMNAQSAYQGLAGMGLLGAQNLNAELWCNCVPARHDMFLRGE